MAINCADASVGERHGCAVVASQGSNAKVFPDWRGKHGLHVLRFSGVDEPCAEDVVSDCLGLSRDVQVAEPQQVGVLLQGRNHREGYVQAQEGIKLRISWNGSIAFLPLLKRRPQITGH